MEQYDNIITDHPELLSIAARTKQAIHTAIERELRLMDLEIDRYLKRTLQQAPKPAVPIKRRSKLKFDPLQEYFRNNTDDSITLSFDNVGEILGEPLCASAYKFREYWWRNGRSRISDAWNSNGYKIKQLDLENQRVSFYRLKPLTIL